jgi:hypothetical protein
MKSARWRERSIRLERVFALAKELLIRVLRVGAYELVELLEREIEHIFHLTQYVCLHEKLGFS